MHPSAAPCAAQAAALRGKLSGAADTLEGRDAAQRDLDKLEKWTCVNLMRPSTGSCTWVGTIPTISTGWG